MQHQIKKYQVHSPVLKKYIKFFWELRITDIQLNHKIIPQRNINMRFNLNDTRHYVCQDNKEKLLEDVYFLGLQNKFTNRHLKLNGDVDVMGICFEPYGIYPFLKIPLSEFKNHILGSDEIGFKMGNRISEQLKGTFDTKERLLILEFEFLKLLEDDHQLPGNFSLLFNGISKIKSLEITEFCRQNNMSLRQLERLYEKYIGLSAATYSTLNRFHGSLNQLLRRDYSKLSDLAYDNGYFDQMHFIKEIKRFTGNTPKNHVKQDNSLLKIRKRS